MSATATKPPARAAEPKRVTRDEAANAIEPLLTDEPVAEAELRRQIRGTDFGQKGGTGDFIRNGLGVLEAQHRAMRIPGTAGSRLGGWVRYEAPIARQRRDEIEPGPDIDFPYEWGVKIAVGDMFIDKTYQRPLTTFVDKIVANFNPFLFQMLALSDRGTKNKPKRYAIIDGQTRWVAAGRLRIPEVPCIVFKNLTPQDEANLFARLQKERRGILSWHRFRADLAAEKPEALEIKSIAEAAGFTLGEGVGELRAVAALEATFKIDSYLLERSLADLKSAWPEKVPDASVIRGLHYFFRHYPIGKKVKRGQVVEIDDERLVRKLKVIGMDGLHAKARQIKAGALNSKGTSEKWVGQAVQVTYDSKS